MIRPLNDLSHVVRFGELTKRFHEVEELQWRANNEPTSLSSSSPFHDKMGMALFTLYEYTIGVLSTITVVF